MGTFFSRPQTVTSVAASRDLGRRLTIVFGAAAPPPFPSFVLLPRAKAEERNDEREDDRDENDHHDLSQTQRVVLLSLLHEHTPRMS